MTEASIDSIRNAFQEHIENLRLENAGASPSELFLAALNDGVGAFDEVIIGFDDGAIVRPLVRPILDLVKLKQSAQPFEFPTGWRPFVSILEDKQLAVGELRWSDPNGQVAPVHGTSWLCERRDLVVTNLHVVQDIPKRLGSSRELPTESQLETLQVYFDAKGSQAEESEGGDAARTVVQAVSHRSRDLAVLRLDRPAPEGIEPLRLSEKGPAEDSPVVAIGYPQEPPPDDQLGLDQIRELFQFEPHTRVVSPGRINGILAWEVLHDCTLASRSSGSPLLNPAGEVVAVHRRGDRLVSNYAVDARQLTELLTIVAD